MNRNSGFNKDFINPKFKSFYGVVLDLQYMHGVSRE